MRHYEIVFLVHPDQSEQVPNIIKKYEDFVKADGGKVHRLEDWGKRQLAYPINKLSRAHYVLMNIECGDKALADINNNFRFNDAVLRNLVLKCESAVTDSSAIFKAIESQTPVDAVIPTVVEDIIPETIEEIKE